MALDGLTRKIISDNKAVINMVKTLTSTPALINTDLSQGAKFAIQLEVETNQMSAQAEVSESLLISQDTKKYISDNVAPGSRTWNLSGYLAGNKALEPTNYYKPIMRLNTDMLWNWFINGAVLIYFDGNARIYNQVVIKSLQTSQQKDAADAVAFQITLKEINVMEISDVVLDNLDFSKIKNSLPKAGSILGESASMGTVTSEALVDTSGLAGVNLSGLTF